MIQGEEKKRIRSEIDGLDVAIIFDGTTRLGEALAVVLRFFSGWKIQQRLVRISLLAKSMTGEEVAREILTVLSTELGIAASHVIAAMRDRASVNNVAMRTVAIMYPSVMDIGCFSHTLDLVGSHFQLPNCQLPKSFSNTAPSLVCCGMSSLAVQLHHTLQQDGGADGSVKNKYLNCGEM